MSLSTSTSAPERFQVTQHPSFFNYWFARIATTMGNQMMMVAVGWQMYDLTHSAWDLGMVGLMQFVPSLALTLVVGQVADRYDRRRILQLCLVWQVVIMLGLTLGTFDGWISRNFILFASLALGAARAFQMPTQQALAPLLVPETVLPQALAFNSAGGQFAFMAGPALGGVIYVAGPEAVYVVCGLLFISAVLFMTRVKLNHPPGIRQPVSLETLFAGIHFIWERKAVLGAISLDLFAVLLGGATALLPIFAKDILHVGPWGLGLLRGGPAIGAFVMSIYLTRRPFNRRVGKVMFAAVAMFGLCNLTFALSTSFVLSLAALILSGAADMISVVIRQALVQLETPNEMRGRVSAVNSIFIGASNQLGEFESGVTAAWWGTVPSVIIGGLGTLAVVAAWMTLFPSLTRRERLVNESPAASPAVVAKT